MTAKYDETKVLERFMKEFFPFTGMKKIGLFTKGMKGDYEAQANRICEFFGFETVYEYGAIEVRCHLSYVDGHKPKDEGFVIETTSIYA